MVTKIMEKEKEEKAKTLEDKLLNFLNKAIMVVGALFMLVKIMQAINY